MKTKLILAAGMTAALISAVAVTNCSLQSRANDTNEIIVPEGKNIDIVAMPIDGKLSYSIVYTDADPRENYYQYDGLTINSHKNIRSFTQSICAAHPDLNHYGVVIEVPEKNISAEIPVCEGLIELLKGAYADDMEITFTLDYLPDWEQFSWRKESVLPDYPQTFLNWNL